MNYKIISLFSILCFLANSCVSSNNTSHENLIESQEQVSKKNSNTEIVNNFKKMGDIVFAEFTIERLVDATPKKVKEKVITKKGKTTTDIDTTSLHKRVFMSTYYTSEAGIKLSSLDPVNCTINEDEVHLILPKVDTFFVKSDAEKSNVLYETYSRITATYVTQTERHEAKLRSLKEIRETIYETGIIEEAQKNAKEFFSLLFQEMGYEEENIKIEFEND